MRVGKFIDLHIHFSCSEGQDVFSDDFEKDFENLNSMAMIMGGHWSDSAVSGMHSRSINFNMPDKQAALLFIKNAMEAFPERIQISREDLEEIIGSP